MIKHFVCKGKKKYTNIQVIYAKVAIKHKNPI